jgi:hypothetical protein
MNWAALLIGSVFALVSCGDDDKSAKKANTGGASGTGSESTGGSGGSSGGSDAASSGGEDAASSGGSNAGSSGSGATDAGADSGPADPCDSALLCERFDDYSGVTEITDQQEFGPWRAALRAGASMDLDGQHAVSGPSALHVHIDETVTAGGRLFADGAQPIFANTPTHIYGRMMMYIDPNGTSVHWTYFGVSGDAEASSPVIGRNASYIMSSLPRNGVNTYSFVYGLEAQGSDGYRDCYAPSSTSMPSTWACISFEMDSVARKLRMYKDGDATPILSVDDHGQGCVAPTAMDTAWYGPSITQLFVGAWSFHPMDAPLDVWIDDLVVDTKPVSCPPP